MNPKKQWEEITKFYKLNIERYNWKAQELLVFIGEYNEIALSNQLYIKAYQTHFGISSTNGFIRRPSNKMVYVYFQNGSYIVRYNSSFFEEYSFDIFRENEIKKAILSIINWINK
jgi:hypothetical protein